MKENEPMVTVPLEEYIELRRKADENFYLSNTLGQLEQRVYETERRIAKVKIGCLTLKKREGKA